MYNKNCKKIIYVKSGGNIVCGKISKNNMARKPFVFFQSFGYIQQEHGHPDLQVENNEVKMGSEQYPDV